MVSITSVLWSLTDKEYVRPSSFTNVPLVTMYPVVSSNRNLVLLPGSSRYWTYAISILSSVEIQHGALKQVLTVPKAPESLSVAMTCNTREEVGSAVLISVCEGVHASSHDSQYLRHDFYLRPLYVDLSKTGALSFTSSTSISRVDSLQRGHPVGHDMI